MGGIDEAGRGSVLGPLVVAGVSASHPSLERLKELGVRDSKLLTPGRRASLYDEIVTLCDEAVSFAIPPPEIDRYVIYGRRLRKLNFLEALHMASLIPVLRAQEVFVDAPDTNPGRFAAELAGMVDPCPKIVAEHKADRNYVVVSAASIVAKVERDRAVEELRSQHGEFGSGYPSDPSTIDYLRRWVEKEGSIPSFARRSWKTWERILTLTLAP